MNLDLNRCAGALDLSNNQLENEIPFELFSLGLNFCSLGKAIVVFLQRQLRDLVSDGTHVRIRKQTTISVVGCRQQTVLPKNSSGCIVAMN